MSQHTLSELSDVIIELEFSWIRQFWQHGLLHSEMNSYWHHAISKLENRWSIIESFLVKTTEHQVTSTEIDMTVAIIIVDMLDKWIQKRKEYKNRCSAQAYKKLPKNMRPVDRPKTLRSINELMSMRQEMSLRAHSEA